MIVFTQFEFDTFSETEVFSKHGDFCNPENFLNQPGTHYFP